MNPSRCRKINASHFCVSSRSRRQPRLRDAYQGTPRDSILKYMAPNVSGVQPHAEGPFSDLEWIGCSRPSPWPGHISCWLPVINHPTFATAYSPTFTLLCSLHPMRSFLCIPLPGKKSSETTYAYVLMHGFADIPALSGSLESIEEVLHKEAGVPKSDILKLQMPPLKSIEERTNSAIRDITAKFSSRTVHLIAHSMVCSLTFPVVGIVVN